MTAPQIARLREEELKKEGALVDYLNEYEEFEGTQNFLNALQNYPNRDRQHPANRAADAHHRVSCPVHPM
uniref:Uncharacterized protein n=1 Tax=Desulfatirhabdium butyrativorans TaxID=340467 RepID=A0A7C4RSP4_9BACT